MSEKIITAENNKAFPVEYNEYITSHPDAREIVDHARTIEKTRAMIFGNSRVGPNPYSDMALPKRSDIEGFIGAGAEKATYDLKDGKVLKVIPFPGNGASIKYVFEAQVEPLIAGIGVEGLEQLVTADLKDGVIITEKSPGEHIIDIPVSRLLAKIQKEHLDKLARTLEAMVGRGLECENMENVFFDNEKGFTILDYRFATDASSEDREKYSHHYQEYLEKHTVDNFLKIALRYKKKTLKHQQNGHGEQVTKLVGSIGRRAASLLIPRHKSGR